MKIKKVPVVLQMENAECGAASLAMIMRYYGNYGVPLEQLRLDCLVSRDGVTAKGIKTAAEKNGLKCRVVKASIDGLKTLDLPVIIHWEMRHFVVLTGYSRKHFFLNDPALGRIKVSRSEFDKSYTGIAIITEKTENFKIERKVTYSFMEKTVRYFLPSLILISLLGMFITVFSTILPFFNSVYLDNSIMANTNVETGAFFVMLLLTMILRYYTGKLMETVSESAARGLNIELSIGFMEKMMKLPVTFFMQRTPVELANRQLAGFETAETICRNVVPIFFQAALMSVYCVLSFKYNIFIAVIGVAAMLCNIVISVITSGKMSDAAAVYKKNNGQFQSSVAAVIDMIDTIKSSACENTVFERLMGFAAMSMQPYTFREKIKLLSSAAFDCVSYLVSAAALLAGVGEILSGDLSVGLTIALMGVLSAFLMPVGSFIRSIASVFDLKCTADRIDDAMNYSEETVFLPDDQISAEHDGSISAENVCFAYDGSDSYALKDVSFRLEKGKSLAITGASGSGKSTLIKLIAGLYTETKGHIYYGKSEKKDMTREYFYSKLAVVSQNVQLYEGTVFDNITMWRDIPYDEVAKACKAACIHNEIVLRKGAYYEKVTENGVNFSGGQRQRIEIARALVRKPEILILDEATSALDTVTEKALTDNIMSLGITLVVIAHRLSTIRNCDEIIVLKDGSIIERGTHESLMSRNGIYASFVKEG